jgi:hypothetical protein
VRKFQPGKSPAPTLISEIDLTDSTELTDLTDLTDSTDLIDLTDLPVCFFSKKHLIETDYLTVIMMKTHKSGDNRALSVYTIILLFYKEN